MTELIERIIPRLSGDESRVLSMPTIQLAMLGGSKGITIEKYRKVPQSTYKSLIARGIASGPRNGTTGIMPLTPFGEQVVAAINPAGGGVPTWPNCGHPRTDENTQSVGVAGVRCRICRREISNRCGSLVRRAA